MRRGRAAANAGAAGRGGTTPHLVIAELNFCVPEDRRVWVLAREAAAAGFAVTVICPALMGHQQGVQRLDGVDIRYFRAVEAEGAAGVLWEAAHNTARAYREVRRARLRRGDVLQVCNPPDTFGPLLAHLARRGVATVYDQHDVVPLLAQTKPSQRPLVPLHRWLERATVRGATRVMTAGQVQADRLQELHGCRASVVRTVAADGSQRHEPPHTASVLGYVGVMGSQDGVDRLLEAAAELVRRGRTGWRLRLAGEGPESARLRRLAQERGLDGAVEFCGWLGPRELEAFLTGVHGLVVPDPVNDFNHSCPMLKVSHALAQGLPLVMTPLRENLLMTGGAGTVAAGSGPAELADAIEEWLGSSAAERTHAGHLLRQRYDNVLAWPLHRARYLNVLAEAVGASS